MTDTPVYTLGLTHAELTRITMWAAAYDAMANMNADAQAAHDGLLGILYEAQEVLEMEAEEEDA